jgi:peptide deformylase
MTVRRVLKMGDPALYIPAKKVTNVHAPEVKEAIIDMQDTLIAYQGAGIAAIQIGIPLRIVIFGAKTPRYTDCADIPLTVIINPEINFLSQEIEERWEGCLSVPQLRGLVPRCAHIRYRGVDPEGRVIDREARGFHARVVQHEVDHLDGILFPMRVTDFRNFGFEDELGFSDLIVKRNERNNGTRSENT